MFAKVQCAKPPPTSSPPHQLQQAIEERGAVAAQLRAVSQTLRDTQNRCHWLEGQAQRQAQVNSPKCLCTACVSSVSLVPFFP